MSTPAGHSLRSGPGGNPRATVLGSLTVSGRPDQVASARRFVAQTLRSHRAATDGDTATLLTSEIVTNAIAHTRSGGTGGTVTIVVIAIPRGVLVEVLDDGSAGTPEVKGDLYAAEGHGLYLVQQMAAQWGYIRDQAGTTVWFHLPAVSRQSGAGGPAAPAERAEQAGYWAEAAATA